MIRNTGRSISQDELAELLEETFPYSRVQQETHINKLIEAQGYSVDEVKAELGHKPHRMFVDIVVLNSDGYYAFEYNGEQHYHLVGNMTKTNEDLAYNKFLDEEKQWILNRIGIPLIIVPYDAYIDETVIADMVDKAIEENDNILSSMYYCDDCGRRFPDFALKNGRCRKCQKEHKEEQKKVYESITQDYSSKKKHKAKKGSFIIVDDDLDDIEENNDVDYEPAAEDNEEKKKQEYKEYMKQVRKERYRQWKESDEYQQKKEEQKQRRKEAYEEIKQKRAMLRKSERDTKRRNKREGF